MKNTDAVPIPKYILVSITRVKTIDIYNEGRLSQILTTYLVVGGGLRPTSIDLQCQLMLLRIWRGHVT